jgi:hypothetical protein
MTSFYTFNISSECAVIVNVEALELIVYSFSKPVYALTVSSLSVIT